MKQAPSKIALTFLVSTALLILLGLAVITTASIPLSQSNFGESFYYFRHQIIYGLGLGLIAFLFFFKIKIGLIKKLGLPAMLAAIVLLTLVFVPHVGYEAGGARRWLNIFGMSFQPSEFAKLALVLYFAAWLESKKNKITEPVMIFPFLLWLGLIGGLVLLEPDFGTFLIICALALVMYYSAGARLKPLLAVGIIGLLVLSSLIAISPYRRERVLSFLDPGRDTVGSGYQLNQALITIGSGGLTGLGLGKGIQKYSYLPETIGDSVFAIISEELGFIGTSLILFIYLIWVLSGLKISALTPRPFEKYLVLGIVVWIGSQTFVNVLGILGLVPFTGIPLPFISYGGSALIIELAAVGLVANVAKGK